MARSPEQIKTQASEYRAMAEQAMRDAERTTNPGTRDQFLKIAAGWLEMAVETENDRFR